MALRNRPRSREAVQQGVWNEQQWLMYWVVFGFISVTEAAYCHFVPLYYLWKMLVLLWMMHPELQGARILFVAVVQPVLLRWRPLIEEGLEGLEELHEAFLEDFEEAFDEAVEQVTAGEAESRLGGPREGEVEDELAPLRVAPGAADPPQDLPQDVPDLLQEIEPDHSPDVEHDAPQDAGDPLQDVSEPHEVVGATGDAEKGENSEA